MEFEKDVEKLLSGGGIKNKSVNVIKDTSRVIKDKIDNKLEQLFDTFKLNHDFFIISPALREVWNQRIVKHSPEAFKS